MSVPAKKQARRQTSDSAATFSQYNDLVAPTVNQTVLQWSLEFHDIIAKLEQPQREPQTVLGDTPSGRKLLVQDIELAQTDNWRPHVLDTWFNWWNTKHLSFCFSLYTRYKMIEGALAPPGAPRLRKVSNWTKFLTDLDRFFLLVPSTLAS